MQKIKTLEKMSTRVRVFLLLLSSISSGILLPSQAQDINLTGYTLTFADEFNSVSVTRNSPKGAATWYYWPPYGAAGAYSASVWDDAAFSVSGGILQDKAWIAGDGKWHSGNLSSMDPTGAGFGQQWGYFEIRCKMPDSKTGAWPAFWIMSKNSILNNLNGTSLPNIEIDIFEWYGVSHDDAQGKVQQATHNWTPSGGPPELYKPQTLIPGGGQPWAGYHIYGCKIDPAFITFYIDGVQVNQIATPTAYVTSPFYIMIDYALGGGWPLDGMVNNSHLDVDWVRVYSLPSQTQPVANGTYKVIARHSGKALSVVNNATGNGALVHQWGYTGSTSQRWALTHQGSSQYRFNGVASGRALDVSGGSTADGADVLIWDWNGANNQKWTLAATSGGYFSVRAVHSGKALDVNSNSTADGARISQWTYNGGNNQQWAFQAP